MTEREKARRIILELFGPLSDVDRATLWGRKSETRARVGELRGHHNLPDPPPIEQDTSLKHAAENRIRGLRRVARGKKRMAQSTKPRTVRGSKPKAAPKDSQPTNLQAFKDLWRDADSGTRAQFLEFAVGDL